MALRLPARCWQRLAPLLAGSGTLPATWPAPGPAGEPRRAGTALAAVASPARRPGAKGSRRGPPQHKARRKRVGGKDARDEADEPEPEPAPEPALDWDGQTSMRPSAALQARLRGLRSSQPSLVAAFDPDALPQPAQPSHAPAAAQAEPPAAEGVAGPADAPEADGELAMPPPAHVRVKQARYVTSSVRLEQCPPATLPEIAVVGRSNVGKSSLINMLTGRRDLALVSKTPGKTRCINHFLINDAWYLVDLPGYGYAKSAKTQRHEWGAFTQQFFRKRETLVNVLLLVDASIPPRGLDLGCAQWLFQASVPFTLVYTKLDKRKKGCPPPDENIAAFEAELARLLRGALPVSLRTSSGSGLGKRELLVYLAQLRELGKGAAGAAGSAPRA